MDVRTEAICELLLLPLSCSLTLVMRQYHKVCHWSVRTDQQRVKRYLTSEENVSGFVLEAEGIHAAVVWSTHIVCLDEICICASHSSTETHHTLVTKMHLCTQNLGCVLPKIFQTRQTVDVPVQSACWYAGYPKCGATGGDRANWTLREAIMAHSITSSTAQLLPAVTPITQHWGWVI